MLASAIFFVPSLTSCLNDTDDNNEVAYHTLTPSEKGAVLSRISGSYTGYSRFYNAQNKLDSVPCSFTVLPDTTAMVKVPVSLLSDHIYDSEEIKSVLKSAPNQDMTAKLIIPSYVSNEEWSKSWMLGFSQMAFIPTKETIEFTEGGHKFKLAFSTSAFYSGNAYYSYPVIMFYETKGEGFVLYSSLTVDDNKKYNLNKITLLSAKK